MDIPELDNLESSVQELLAQAKRELEERRIQQQRDQQVQKITSEITQRLEPLLKDVEKTLAEFPADDFSYGHAQTRQKLEETRASLLQQLADAPLIAARKADEQLLLNEQRLLDEKLNEQQNRWRYELKADLIEMLQEQPDFYSATDAAIALRPYVQDLKAIGALEEVVQILIDQINLHSTEGPVAKLRGTHEQTLNFIYDKAMENRSRVERAPDVQPRTRHRSSERRPNPYGDLEGKVVAFGGHDRLETAVRNRLRDSNVELIWCTAQGGLQLAEQAENHIYSADLVLIITGYASHALTEKAIQAADRAGKSPEMINTTGMTRVLEAIEYGLKSKLLARRLNFSRSA